MGMGGEKYGGAAKVIGCKQQLHTCIRLKILNLELSLDHNDFHYTVSVRPRPVTLRAGSS